MQNITDERLIEVVEYSLANTDVLACATFNINTETLSRYKRAFKKLNDNRFDEKKTIRDLKEQFSETELKALLKSKKTTLEGSKTVQHTFEGDVITFAHVTDTHIGSIFFDERMLMLFFEECEKQGVDFIAHSGDLTEGLSNRPGHWQELTHIGYDQQRDYATELLGRTNIQTYVVSGNHDLYYSKSNGANIVKDVCSRLDHVTFLGNHEGDLNIKGAIVRIWHGIDGSSYATSYRPQKLIEAFTGGEKPNVLLMGHTHKSIYMFDRNVHAISGGALCWQSSFMRGKKLANHTGFYIIKMCVNDGQVNWIEPRFYPFYKKLNEVTYV